MKKLFSFFTLAILAAASVSAAEITPAQALQRFQNSQSLSRSDMAHPVLAYTVENQGRNALYVFNSDDNFMILAADDAVTPLIGYSDCGTFDPQNIPDNMDFYLRAISAEITSGEGEESPVERAEISPLLTTRWNQLSPYNLLTPTWDKKTPTGCVATALAQVLNYHKYPAQAVGKIEYTYDYNGNTVSVKKVLSKFIFDWPNMLDDYSGQYTEEQSKAVSELMFACGLAVQSKYKPSATSSTSIKTLAGIINHLACDKSAEICRRSYYTSEAWEELIYNELSNKRPVMLGGSNSKGGHEFVADGYRNELFHINWGWGGLSNGYFKLSALNPDQQGTGGTSGGYNEKLDAIIGLMPDQGNPVKYKMVLDGDFTVNDKKSYDRSLGEFITVGNSKTLYLNFCSTPITEFEMGWVLNDLNGDSTKQVVKTFLERDTLKSMAGINSYKFSCSKLPVGEWKVTQFWRHDGGENQQFTQNEGTCKELIVKVTPSLVTVEEAPQNAIHDIYSSASTSVYYDLMGRRIENPMHGIFIRVKDGKATKVTRK